MTQLLPGKKILAGLPWLFLVISEGGLAADAQSLPDRLMFTQDFIVEKTSMGWQWESSPEMIFEDAMIIPQASGDDLTAEPQYALIRNIRHQAPEGYLFDAVLPASSGEGHIIIDGLGGTSVPFHPDVHPFDIDTQSQFLAQYKQKALIRYGEVFIAHKTVEGRRARSQILDQHGRPMTDLISRIYETRLANSGQAEFAMQVGNLESAHGPTPLLFHPIDRQGQPLPLPEGALGMVPLQLETGVCWNWFRPDDGSCEALRVGHHTGWAIVYDGATGLEYSLGLGSAAEVLAGASGKTRYLGLRYLDRNDGAQQTGTWLAAQSPEDALWHIFDPETLESRGQGDMAPELALATLSASTPNPWGAVQSAQKNNQTEVKADLERLQLQAEARQREQEQLEQDSQYGARRFLTQIKRLTSDPATVLWAARKAGCDVFLEEITHYQTDKYAVVETAKNCGASEEFVRQNAPESYRKWQENREYLKKLTEQQEAYRNLGQAISNYFKKNMEPEDVTVLINDNGILRQERMSRTRYDNYYNPNR